MANHDEGHGGSNAPSTVDGKKFISPATMVPLSTDGKSVNSKRPEGVKGK